MVAAAVDGSLPKDEVGPLKAAALAEPELAARARTSSRLELLWANVVAGSLDNGNPKNGPCLVDVCAELVFYDWDGRYVIGVVLDRRSTRVLKLEGGQGQPWLTAALKNQAIAIAAADPLIAPLVGTNPGIANVADVTGAGSCATNLCALVGLMPTDGTLRGRLETLGILVDLHRGIVVAAKFLPDLDIDRRFEK